MLKIKPSAKKKSALIEHKENESASKRPLGENPGDFYLITASHQRLSADTARLVSLFRNSAVRDDSISGRTAPEAPGVIMVMEEEEKSE